MLGDFMLESGAVIHDFELSYVTHGTLAADGGNAVLMTISLSGNHHRLDCLIGPGLALDPARWFVICVDPIGNGLTTSPSTSARQRGMAFPRFQLRDMVESQRRLLDHLGIDRLAAIVGASMGGMQALQWGVSHPDRMDAIVAMTPMAKTAPWAVAVVETARLALMADPAWDGSRFTGYPGRGWRAWSGVMSVLAGRTPEALTERYSEPAAVIAWIDQLAEDRRRGGFDATDWLYQSWAYQDHDVGATPGFGGDTAAALHGIRARTLVMTPPLDLFNPSQAGEDAAAKIPGALHATIPSVQGHQAASSLSAADAAFLNHSIGTFLDG
ncbi:MAG: alpha/beta fold hydrolase [Burkholderiales bacterium]|nr:alpha/beta fold hydrolase [Burkholderiales bacterium]